MTRQIHCYAEGSPGAWEAVCLDFDIAVQGDTFEEVYRDLNKGIALFVDYLKDLPEREQAVFLERKAPLSLRLRFVWLAMVDLFNLRTDTKERHEFIAPFPALPA